MRSINAAATPVWSSPKTGEKFGFGVNSGSIMDCSVDVEIPRRSDFLHEVIRYFSNFGPPIFNEWIKNRP
jgi:hypothetical protein